MHGETALDEGWARYSRDQLERLLERLLEERGVPRPSVIADLRNEIARRRDSDPRDLTEEDDATRSHPDQPR
jgi:hypothetical protein